MTDARLEVVVIGSGRSGTAWAARRLTESGIPCGHESVFDWHPSSDPSRRLDYPGRTPSPHEPPPDVELRAESSLAAIAHLSHVPESCHVWHVARDPLAVITSWAGGGILADQRPSTPYGRFVVAHVPAVAAEAHVIGRAARWVAEWNLRGAAAAEALRLPYRLTRLEDENDEPVNQHRHPRAAPPVTWEDVAEFASIDTAELVGEWATLAGYPIGVAPGDTVAG